MQKKFEESLGNLEREREREQRMRLHARVMFSKKYGTFATALKRV